MMTGGQMELINERLFGVHEKILNALEKARSISTTEKPTLIVGEKGVGKKTLAMYIHIKSGRTDRNLTVVDCDQESQVVENLILGHRDPESGRFVKGAIENSNNGTVVLANIDCLADKFQAKLIKILGELKDYDFNIRLLATTTKNLSKLVGSGKFHRALYNVFMNETITMIPLRDRPQDIELLTVEIIKNMNEKDNTQHRITDEALEKLMTHYWAQNTKELFDVIKTSISKIGEEGGPIQLSHISIGEKLNVTDPSDISDGIALMSLKEAEKLLIKKALIHTSENRTQAAKILGVSIRTLRNKINEYRHDGSSYFVNLR
jgi:two-component system, response regulator FlrC